MPALAANSLTTLHTTFSVMPLPQTEPVLFTQRNSRPVLMSAIVVQTSTELNPLRGDYRWVRIGERSFQPAALRESLFFLGCGKPSRPRV